VRFLLLLPLSFLFPFLLFLGHLLLLFLFPVLLLSHLLLLLLLKLLLSAGDCFFFLALFFYPGRLFSLPNFGRRLALDSLPFFLLPELALLLFSLIVLFLLLFLFSSVECGKCGGRGCFSLEPLFFFLLCSDFLLLFCLFLLLQLLLLFGDLGCELLFILELRDAIFLLFLLFLLLFFFLFFDAILLVSQLPFGRRSPSILRRLSSAFIISILFLPFPVFLLFPFLGHEIGFAIARFL